MWKRLHVYEPKLKEEYKDLLDSLGFRVDTKDFLIQHMFLDGVSFASKHNLRYFKWNNGSLTTVLDRKINCEPFTNILILNL